jgi:Ca-activated chloride channel family protein
VSFESPLLLGTLAVVPLALAGYWLAQRRRRRYVARFPGVPTLAAVAGPPSALRHLPTALFALALAILALALARPQATVAVPVERASVVLVTDVSGSMRASDVQPNRLAAAKRAARSFLDDVPDQLEVGSVAFATAPHSVEAPTDDHEQVAALIEGLSADGGTATGDALQAALGLFEGRRKDRRPPAAIVLLSDGQTTTGRDPVEVAREAKRKRVPIYTVSLGTQSGSITTPLGNRIPVTPDPETMREIAKVSGGQAFEADDDDELDTVYERLGTRIGSKHEKREITAGFAAGGIVLLIAAAATSLRAFGRLP